MRRYKLLPLIAIILFSCSDTESTKAIAMAKTVVTNREETFDSFNERFHSDSSFQLSRIAFPIGGRYADGENSHEWTVRNWELLKEPVKETVETTEYKHSLQQTDSTVVEKYWIEDSGFKTERHFGKKGGKWFLTYYEDIDI